MIDRFVISILTQSLIYWQLSSLMHQSFATTSPRGPGNSGDIDFFICKAQVKSLHCRDLVLVKSLPPGNYFLIHGHLPWTPAINLLHSRSDKKKKKVAESGDIFLFTTKCFHQSVATDKLDMTEIYSKWAFILLKRNWLFVILNHVNSQNKTLLQLTLDLLSFRHIEIVHQAILQIPANILSKHRTISR